MSKSSTAQRATFPGSASDHPLVQESQCNDLRLSLCCIIPIYARAYLTSLTLVLKHVSVISSLGTGVAILSLGKVPFPLIWNLACALFCTSLPLWGASKFPLKLVNFQIEGWRWEFIYWVFAARQMTHILPERYGGQMEVCLSHDLIYRSLVILNEIRTFLDHIKRSILTGLSL